MHSKKVWNKGGMRLFTSSSWMGVCRFLIVGAMLSAPFAAFAANAPSPTYQAKSYGITISAKPGQVLPVVLTFANIGKSTWNSQTSVYIYGNASPIGDHSWADPDRPGLLSPAAVKPGQFGSASFLVDAPTKPGTYSQNFLIGWNESNWIKGSTVTITLTVAGTPVASPAVAPTTVQTTPAAVVASQPAPKISSLSASLISKGGLSWQLNPDVETTVTLTYKNTSQQAWATSGPAAVYAVVGGNRTSSPFHDASWASATLIASSTDSVVRPGGLAHFTIPLRAPEEVGTYAETFELHDASGALLSGSQVPLPITVTTPNGYVPKGVVNGMDPSLLTATQIGTFKASLLAQSVTSLSLTGNSRVRITTQFKNTGTAAWNNVSLRISGVMAAMSNINTTMRDMSWADPIDPINGKNPTPPGAPLDLSFELKAPALHGTYTAQFQLIADGQPVAGGLIDIPVTVTADGLLQSQPTTTPAPTPTPTPTPSSSSSPTPTPIVSSGNWTPSQVTDTSHDPSVPSGAPTPIPLGGNTSGLPQQPIIRVGIYQTQDSQMLVQGVVGGFNVTQNGSTVCTFTLGQVATFRYSNGTYSVSGTGCNVQSSGVYQAVAPDGISPLEMPDYPRPVSWLPGANDDKFRGKLELNASSASDVWVINELPIEWYLKGLGETSNSSPPEFQKALLTAARTYAMYLLQHNTKHADEHYTIDATYDQVYRGYGAEARDPAVVAAVDATHGLVVTYDGKLAITPYYSRSDGRTRSWTEVWGGGPYPWLVSVQVPWDVGQTLWGHGVGMSATGALGAAADGWTYDHILNYFYNGTSLGQVFQ